MIPLTERFSFELEAQNLYWHGFYHQLDGLWKFNVSAIPQWERAISELERTGRIGPGIWVSFAHGLATFPHSDWSEGDPVVSVRLYLHRREIYYEERQGDLLKLFRPHTVTTDRQRQRRRHLHNKRILGAEIPVVHDQVLVAGLRLESQLVAALAAMFERRSPSGESSAPPAVRTVITGTGEA